MTSFSLPKVLAEFAALTRTVGVGRPCLGPIGTRISNVSDRFVERGGEVTWWTRRQ
jgi:hypothetical protein